MTLFYNEYLRWLLFMGTIIPHKKIKVLPLDPSPAAVPIRGAAA